MTDYYSVLGVSEDASTAEIKRAFRKKAFDHHPDSARNTSPDAKGEFQKILQAYETLRDPAKRAQYDAIKNVDFGAMPGPPSSNPWSAARGGRGPTVEEWERQFDEWMRRMENQFGQESAEAERIRKERASAERLAKAEAWEREKREAKIVKERSLRMKKRAENAKFTRQAAVLRTFWQTKGSLVWQDAVVGAAFLVFFGGIAFHWKTSILQTTSRDPIEGRC